MTDTSCRRAGLAAVVLALASIVLAPLNALARMRTDSGLSDYENPLASWWARPAMDVARPVLDWASPDTVYETYGKFYVFAVVAALACALAVRSRRPPRQGWAERWGWRIALAAYALTAVSLFFTYWVANLDIVFLAVTIPSLLLSSVGNVLLGIGLIRGGFRPRLTGWVLAFELPLSIGLVAISTQALGMWPMMLAWGAAGWSLWRHPTHELAEDSTASISVGAPQTQAHPQGVPGTARAMYDQEPDAENRSARAASLPRERPNGI